LAQYTAAVATRITRAVDDRLRLHALMLRQPMTRVLDELLDEALPSADELAEQARNRGSNAPTR
jgi:hypothetical protein